MTITRLAGVDNATAHVIFLHGLNGSIRSWRVGGGRSNARAQATIEPTLAATEYWPAWLSVDIPGLAVWVVSFPARAIFGRAMHHYDRAANLLPQILAEPELQSGVIALVGYSFGGIVAKAILRAAEDNKSDPKTGSFFDRASRIALIATPNVGVGAAKAADYLRRLLSPSAATIGLIDRDPSLRELHNWFRNWAEGRTDSVRVFTETLPTPWIGMVVPPESADGGVGRPIPIDADHSTIVRIASRHDELYRILAEFLRDMPGIEQARRPITPRLGVDGRRISGAVVRADFVEAQPTGLSELLGSGPTPGPNQAGRPVEIIDEALSEALGELLRGRFLREYPTRAKTLQLSARLMSGDFMSASQRPRSHALAWCARILSYVEGEQGSAAAAVRLAEQLGSLPELSIAQAFIKAATGDVSSAMEMLSALNTPASRAASVAIQARQGSPFDALKWVEAAGITPDRLDDEGKQFLLSLLIANNRWADAAQIADAITDEEATLSPNALWLAGTVLLSKSAAVELREAVLSQVFFHPRTFPWSAEAGAVSARRRAERLLERFAVHARDLSCPRQAEQAEDLALWIRLREPARTDSALAELQASMADASTAIRRIGMAIDYGLDVDIAEVERRLDQHEALVGGKSLPTAAARYVLAFIRPSGEAAAYLKIHRDQLLEYLNPPTVLAAEAQLLVASGQREHATALLEEFQERLLPQEFEQISAVIASAGATDHVAEAIKTYENDKSLTALLSLVEILSMAERWGALVTYAETLFGITGDLHAFERLIQAIGAQDLREREYKLLAEHPDLRAQSVNLEVLWAWALFRAGDFAASETVLDQLMAGRDDENDRALFVNLAIASGRWEALGGFVEKEFQSRSLRSAKELLRAAKVAAAIKSPRSLDLARAAADLADNDPTVLVEAYSVATSVATDDTPEAAGWLRAAVAVSAEDGPIQSVSLEDLIDRAPEWHQGQKEVAQKLDEGELPLFLAARFQRSTVTHLVLLRALANLREMDPTARPLIPVRRGIDRPALGALNKVALDPTALLVLALCGQLDQVFAAVDRVVVPHGTLSQLFADGQKLPYHQPSLVKQAQVIRDALSTRALHRFVLTTTPDDALSREVGAEMAALLVEAKAQEGRNGPPRVVHPPPIYKSGSLLRELADLGKYEAQIVSCTQVLASLDAVGALTKTESDHAWQFLQMQEPGDANATALPLGTPLYLGSLSIGFLYQAGLLDKLGPAGFPSSLSPEAVAHEDSLLRYSKLANDVAEVVEKVRRALGDGLASGKVRVAHSFRSPAENDVPQHPTADIFRLAGDVDVIVCDDRSLGRYLNVNHDSRLVPVTSSVDLIEALSARGATTRDALETARNRLRAANLCLLPLSVEEIDFQLRRTQLDAEGELVETAELRVIRESFLSIRASSLLQLPAEGGWLIGAIQAIRLAIRAQWREGVTPELAARRAQWLLGLCDLRGWAHRLPAHRDGDALVDLYARSIAPLLFPLTEVPEEYGTLYWGWITDVLEALEFSNPAVVARLVALAENAVLSPPDAQELVT